MITDEMVRALKRKADLALAEWRHAWDYEKDPNRKKHAYEQALHHRARLEAYQIVQEKTREHRGFALAEHPANMDYLIQCVRSRLIDERALRYE